MSGRRNVQDESSISVVKPSDATIIRRDVGRGVRVSGARDCTAPLRGGDLVADGQVELREELETGDVICESPSGPMSAVKKLCENVCVRGRPVARCGQGNLQRKQRRRREERNALCFEEEGREHFKERGEL